MKINISKNILVKALTNVSKAFNGKPVIPSLANFKLSLCDECLEVLASNGETSILDKIQKENLDGTQNFSYDSNGEFLLPIYVFEIIKKLDEDDLSISIFDDTITIKTSTSDYSCSTIAAKEYPNIVLETSEKEIKLDAKEFAKAVSQVAFAASTKMLTPILTAINIRTKDGKMILTATDGGRISRKIIDVDYNVDQVVNIPAKIAIDVARMCETLNTISLGIQEKRAYFRIGSILLFSTLLTGNFHDFTDLLSPKFTIDLEVNAKEIINVLERVCLIFIEGQPNARFLINADEFIIKSKTNRYGKVLEQIKDFKYTSKEFGIVVDCNFVIQAIRAIGKDNIKFKFVSDTKPFYITCDDEPNLIQAISCMSVKSAD